MKLSHLEVQASYYALAGFIRQLNLVGRPVPAEVGRLYQRLDTILRLSSTRHETSCSSDHSTPLSEQDEWIGSTEVAHLLNRPTRWVQRHATEMGGQIVMGRWLFRESMVVDYAEGAGYGRTGTGG